MLELENIAFNYHKKPVLSQVNASIPERKITTIIGKNGCGKSTLLKICAGILSLTIGKIKLNGKSLNEYSPVNRAKEIGYFSQNKPSTNLTVDRLIKHGLYPYLSNYQSIPDEFQKRIDWAITVNNLKEFQFQQVSKLSGGEIQRVYLSMLLVQNPNIFLLDEPTSFLDIDYQFFLLNLIRTLKNHGKTIVMVLHDIAQALNYSDNIIVLNNNTIENVGTPDEIITSKCLEKIYNIHISKINNNTKSEYYVYPANNTLHK